MGQGEAARDEHDWRKSRLNTFGLYSNQDIMAYDCEESESCGLPFPIIADRRGELAVALGMLDPEEKDKDGMHAVQVSKSHSCFCFQGFPTELSAPERFT